MDSTFYLLVLIADVLLALTIACQQKYQAKAGTSVKSSLLYTILTSVISAAIFFVINRFTVRITLFSVICASLFSVVFMLRLFVGFHIMKSGNVSLYTLFLMSGGMVVPYIYGTIFLHEELNPIRIVGLLLIVVAITVTHLSKDKIDRKQFTLCIVVFLLNGASSVISKIHQVSAASEIVQSSDFVFLVMISNVIISLLVLLLKKEKSADKSIVSIKPVILIIFIAAIADGISYLFQLFGATNLPATVLYPLVTGGTIILSPLMGFIICKEKICLKQWMGIALSFLGTLMFL